MNWFSPDVSGLEEQAPISTTRFTRWDIGNQSIRIMEDRELQPGQKV